MGDEKTVVVIATFWMCLVIAKYQLSNLFFKKPLRSKDLS